MNKIFKIKGNKPLKGEIKVSGFKNAALPILASTLAISGKSIIKNVPKISDVENFLEILNSLGADISFLDKHTLEIDTDNIKPQIEINHLNIQKMRGSILLLGPLLARFKEVKIPYPGGCALGKRPADSHLQAFAQFGAEVIESGEYIHLKLPKTKSNIKKIILPEMSVTATENIITFLSYFEQETELRMAAQEPHVRNLCQFLQSAGAEIKGIGTHNLKIKGYKLQSAEIKVIPDMLEAGAFILAGILTRGEVLVNNVIIEDFDSFFQKLYEVGINLEINENKKQVRVTQNYDQKFKPINLKTAVFPSFPTDLMAPFAVLLTQCNGVSKIFETLFDGRFSFLVELEKMGVKYDLLNPHQAIIIGKSDLQGAQVASQDLRAGAAMVLAALAAKGESEISNINYIFRGYEDIVNKLQSLGADISVEKK